MTHSSMMKSTNAEFHAIMARRAGTPKGAMISRITKTGEPGKPAFFRFFGTETTAQEVIIRLERNNPGQKYIEA